MTATDNPDQSPEAGATELEITRMVSEGYAKLEASPDAAARTQKLIQKMASLGLADELATP